ALVGEVRCFDGYIAVCLDKAGDFAASLHSRHADARAAPARPLDLEAALRFALGQLRPIHGYDDAALVLDCARGLAELHPRMGCGDRELEGLRALVEDVEVVFALPIRVERRQRVADAFARPGFVRPFDGDA